MFSTCCKNGLEQLRKSTNCQFLPDMFARVGHKQMNKNYIDKTLLWFDTYFLENSNNVWCKEGTVTSFTQKLVPHPSACVPVGPPVRPNQSQRTATHLGSVFMQGRAQRAGKLPVDLTSTSCIDECRLWSLCPRSLKQCFLSGLFPKLLHRKAKGIPLAQLKHYPVPCRGFTWVFAKLCINCKINLIGQLRGQTFAAN